MVTCMPAMAATPILPDNAAARVASIGGTALGSLAAFPAFDAMRQALPMVQAILLMAIYVMLPLIRHLRPTNSKPLLR